MVLCFICVSILKIISKKGHKSSALRLLGIIIAVFASFGMIAYSMNKSIGKTNKVSFKAAGLKYRKQFKVVEIKSLPDAAIEEKQRTEKDLQKVSNFSKAPEVKKSTNSSSTRVVKQLATEKTDISLDLQVLSSFDCVRSIPTILLDYISNTFLHEYGRSHKDFHSQHEIDETLPLLNQFNISCNTDQNCSAFFQYDKQYGISTTADKTYSRPDVFYCCPSVHLIRNQTISNVCEQAQTVTGKSIFRESKNSVFLERVIEKIFMR